MCIMDILLFIFSIVLVESITELLTKSEVFSPVRAFFHNRRQNKVFDFIHRLMDCGYCTSVWSGWFIALVFFKDIGIINEYVDWFFVGLFLHRAANILHFLIDRLDRYKDVSLGQGEL